MIHLVIDYLNGMTRYYPVPEDQGWQVDTTLRMLVIGRGVPRKMVPLDTVSSIEIERCLPPTDEEWLEAKLGKSI